MTENETLRVWIEMACPKCPATWRIMSADAEGRRAVDSEMRDCRLCGSRGFQTGIAPRTPGEIP